MRFISDLEFGQLIDGAQLLRRDLHGPKVYLTGDGRVVKLFRVKRWWSSSMLYPYSWRFLRNSRRLRRRGLPCVEVEEIFYCRAIRRHGVIYWHLEGRPLDALLRSGDPSASKLYTDYAAYIAALHAQRVYFRSLHPGNILLLPDGEFGLIDIADMRFPLRALGLRERRRNFNHLLRSAEFREVMALYPAEPFIQAYIDEARLRSEDIPGLAEALRNDFAAMHRSGESA